MKLGILISVAILAVVFGALIFFLHTPAPDAPTQLTSPKNLEKVSLPTDLPGIFTVDSPGESANDAYQKVFEYYQTNRDQFVDRHGGLRTDGDPAYSDELINLLITASKAGKVTTPFLDDAVSFVPGDAPAFGDALETVPDVALVRAKKIFEQGDTARGIAAAEAVWALGQRALEKSVRMYPRLSGLQMMITAGQIMSDWSDKLPADMEAKLGTWGDALLKFRAAWDPKVTLVHTLHPHQGDLINMARNERDPGLRTEAIIMIGVSKFSPDHKGNAVGFEETLEAAKNDPDPMIQKAGAAADAFTREQMSKMR